MRLIRTFVVLAAMLLSAIGCSENAETEQVKPDGSTTVSGAQEASQSPVPDRPPLAQLPWIITYHHNPNHVIDIEINDNPLAVLTGPDDPEVTFNNVGFRGHENVLGEGNNTIAVTFTISESGHEEGSTQFQLLLSPTMEPGKDMLRLLPEIKLSGLTHAEIVAAVNVESDHLQAINVESRIWLSEAKTRLLSHTTETRVLGARIAETSNATEWYANGRPKSSEEFRGAIIINGRYSSPDGQHTSEVKEGTGSETRWYDNGDLKLELPLRNGKWHGKVVNYYKHNVVRAVRHLENGVHVGEVLSNHSNGKPHIRGQYVNDRRNGKWVSYDEDGKIVAEAIFKDGAITEGADQFFWEL